MTPVEGRPVGNPAGASVGADVLALVPIAVT